MTKEEIQKGVKQVLSKLTGYAIDDIKEDDVLSVYPPSMAIAKKIYDQFPKVNLTNLTNSLDGNLSSVADLIDYVNNVYNP